MDDRQTHIVLKDDFYELLINPKEAIPKGAMYDVVSTNINRNVLIELIPELLGFLKKDSKLLLSGLLEEDEGTIKALEPIQKLTYLETRQQQEWIAMVFEL